MNIYKNNGRHDYDLAQDENFWIGGHYPASNASNGYHGILKLWWDFYKKNNSNWLLVSEKEQVKTEFKSHYSNDKFFTIEPFCDPHEVDYNYDICDINLTNMLPKFDIVLSQATLEHVYDPFSAMRNLLGLLSDDGMCLVHTHLPNYEYHPYPQDYFRFQPDWFVDLEKYVKNVELVELVGTSNKFHIFALYRRKFK